MLKHLALRAWSNQTTEALIVSKASYVRVLQGSPRFGERLPVLPDGQIHADRIHAAQWLSVQHNATNTSDGSLI